MRIVSVVALIALVSSAAAAQTSSPPPAPPPAPPMAPSAAPAAAAPANPAAEGISRDDYIAKARAAAEKRAGTRFDAMDADHDGILTKAEIAAYRAAHRKKREDSSQ
ncbi:MAG TPA: hypothetical protein VFC56_03495 [Stellaceae bacterium]|nr:hypothetical protein [Stellaceae bacterium]